MKKLNKYIMFFAAAAMTFASCAKEELNTIDLTSPDVYTVRFGAEIDDSKVVSTSDDKSFTSSWIENTDKIGVTSYAQKGTSPIESNRCGTWSATPEPGAFATQLIGENYTPDDVYDFIGVYPYSENGTVDFGNERTQYGNEHNAQYDIMISERTSCKLPAENRLILKMNRQTATVYFHLNSVLNEKVISATLITESPVAANTATLSHEKFEYTTDETSNHITLSIDGEMSSNDMQFWFNVLPVKTSTLKLVIETEKHTFTMNKKTSTTWKAGHLYTTVIEGIPANKWVEKIAEPEPVEVTKSIASYAEANGWNNDTKYTSVTLDNNVYVTVSGTSNTGKYYTIDDTWRIYQSETGTATFLFTQSDGYEFIDAKVSYLIKNTGVMTYNGANVASGDSFNVSGKTKFTIGVGNTGTASNGQVQITEIYVKYKPTSFTPFDPLNPSYAITVNSGANGTVEAKNAKSETITYAKAGEIVTLIATPNTGYTLTENSLIATNSVTETPIAFTEGTTFTMPAANVIVEAAFEQAEYTVTGITKTDDNHGEVTVNKKTAYYGDEIELTVTHDEGYRLKEGSLKINGSITPTQKIDGETPVENEFVFNMPAEDATVSATFEVIKYELSDQSGSHGRLEFYYLSDLTTAISEAASGESVKVVAVPVDATYQLKSGTLSVYRKGNTSDVYDLENDVFTMPANAVSATATFENAVFNLEKDSESELEFTIKNEQGDAISSSIASRTGAVKTIRLEATGVPNDKQAKWTVTTAVGPVSTSTVTGNENAVTFVMPAADVKIKCVKGDKASTVTFSGADNADYKFPTGSDGLIENDNIIAKNVKVSFTGASSNSYYDGSVVRFYSGNTMTVAPLNGAVITKVEIVRQSTTSNNSGVISATINSVAQTVTGTTTGTNTWEGNTANPIVFTNNGQCRFTTVKVTYSGGSVVNVTSVTLDSQTMELNIGEDKTLTATVYPDNATNKNVTWTSSAPGVATVSDNGVVKGIAEGTATITVKTVDGNHTATCAVTVEAGGGGSTPIEATFGSDWNSVFGTSYSGTISGIKANSLTLEGTVNNASIKVTNGTSTNGYVKTSDFRAYNGYTITLTAPTGKNITSISSTKGGKNFSSGVSANVGTLSISNNTISWSGSSISVVLSISGTVSFATIVVTYE